MNTHNHYPKQDGKQGKVARALKGILSKQRAAEQNTAPVPEFGTKQYVDGLKSILDTSTPKSKVRAAEHGIPGATNGIDLNLAVRNSLGNRKVHKDDTLDLTHLIITGASEVLGVVVRSRMVSRGHGLGSNSMPMQADIVVLPYGANRDEAINRGSINGSLGNRGEGIDMAALRIQRMKQTGPNAQTPAVSTRVNERLSVSFDADNTMVMVNEGPEPAYIIDGSTLPYLSGENATYVAELTETMRTSVFPWDPSSTVR